MSPIFSLSIHADYRCRHSGACCRSGWPIPVERVTWERLSRLVDNGTLERPSGGDAFAPADGAPPHIPVTTALNSRGHCVFYEPHASLCAIHRRAGPAMLPVACRQFPRVTLVDGRGLFVNLSHYCPTAAGMLFRDDVPLQVVEDPAAFPADFDYDPLDARGALPPLLTPKVLMDLRAFDAWERAVIAVFAAEHASAEQALAQVAAFTERVREWTPGGPPLEQHVAAAARERPQASSRPHSDSIPRHYSLVRDAIPAAVRPAPPPDRLQDAFDRWIADRWTLFARPVQRYLAAKSFATWLAYQRGGLRTIVFSVAVALSVLKTNLAVEAAGAARALDADLLISAIRRTDELLVHLARADELARRLFAVETVAAGLSSDVR